jgi:hypothetical protein
MGRGKKGKGKTRHRKILSRFGSFLSLPSAPLGFLISHLFHIITILFLIEHSPKNLADYSTGNESRLSGVAVNRPFHILIPEWAE